MRQFTVKRELSLYLLPEFRDRLHAIKNMKGVPWNNRASWTSIFYNYSINDLLKIEQELKPLQASFQHTHLPQGVLISQPDDEAS